MDPVTSVDEARRLIQAYEGDAEDFLLPSADELQDPIGINLALVTDSILAREWQPDGYVRETDFRIHKYKGLP
jgi:hypothetical protein